MHLYRQASLGVHFLLARFARGCLLLKGSVWDLASLPIMGRKGRGISRQVQNTVSQITKDVTSSSSFLYIAFP